MFYSQFILAKKGPLGTIWIAAHLERKLRKNQVTETNISVSVDSILFPEVPIALRLSGHLLLGVVRIYSRKVNYLFHDCSEALSLIKQAFNSGAVDLPPDAATAPFHSITIPENFDLDELEPLPEREYNALFSSSAMDQHVTAREQITLQEPLTDDAYLAIFELDERLPAADIDRMDMDFDEEVPEKIVRQESSPVAHLEEDEFPPMTEDEGLNFDQLEPEDPSSPAVARDGFDDEEMFQHTLTIDSLEPMLDDERLEPGTLVGDDDMEYEQRDHHSSPGHIKDGVSIDEGKGVEANGNDFDVNDNVTLQNAAGAANNGNVDEENQDSLQGPHCPDTGRQQDDEEAGQVRDSGLQETVAPGNEEVSEVVAEAGKQPETESAPVHQPQIEGVPELSPVPHDDGHNGGEDALGQGTGDANGMIEPVEGNAAAETPDVTIEPPAEEVPEYEVLRSAVDVVEQEPDMLEIDKDPLVDDLRSQGNIGGNEDQIMEDVVEPLQENDEIMEDAFPARDEIQSPHLSSPVHDHDVPDNNDVLAEILGGRSTPAFGVVPTPLAVVPPREVKPRAQKKRKAVFDLFDLRTVIHADDMRDQLANTNDIRRVRKKAPCTGREFWLLQRELQARSSFREPSVPGLCPALRELFHRVCVYGDADLPKLGPRTLLLQYEKTPEIEACTEDAVLEQRSGDLGATVGGEMNNPSHTSSPDRDATVPSGDGNTEHLQEATLEQPLVDVDTSAVEGEGPNGCTADLPHANGDTVGVVDTAHEEVDDDEAARQAAREAVLLEWETFDNATLEDENLKEGEAQRETEICDTEATPTQPVNQVSEEADLPVAVAVAYATCKEVGDDTLPLETVDCGGSPDPVSVPDTVPVDIPIGEIQRENSPKEETVPSEDAQPEMSEAEFTVPCNPDTCAAELTLPVDDPRVDNGDLSTDNSGAQPLLDVENGCMPVDNTPVDHDTDHVDENDDSDGAHPNTPGDDCEVEDLGFLGDLKDAEKGEGQHEKIQYMDIADYGENDTLPQDNTGWSARTRAVGGYLRTTLESMEMNMKRVEGSTPGPAKLGLDRTLAGKSKKEAARMFFETLVLKTKDYIHVEQEQPYGDIKLSARPQLLKATF